MNRKGFEFSFAWLFAILVGAVVIFLAIYATTSLIGSGRYETDTKIAAQLESILSPVGTNLEDSKFVRIGFPDETRIYNRCSSIGIFGSQLISTSVRSGIGKEWLPPGGEIESKDKYVFSKSVLQGEEAYVFVKSFEMPYDVADIITIYSGEYCFINPGDEIEEEVMDLRLPGINISESLEKCKPESIKVCFSSFDRDCDKKVSQTDVDGLYYEEGLVYAAIFSDAEVYECQVRRLMKRTSELAEIYAKKSEFLAGKGCSSNLAGDLGRYSSLLGEFENSGDLRVVKSNSEEIEDKNERLSCELF